MPIKMLARTDRDRHAAQYDFMHLASPEQRAEMVAYCEREAHEGIVGAEVLSIGVSSSFVLIDWSTGVQVWLGHSYLTGAAVYYVGRPAHQRNSGVRSIDYYYRLDDALLAADQIAKVEGPKMARRHAAALKMNGSN